MILIIAVLFVTSRPSKKLVVVWTLNFRFKEKVQERMTDNSDIKGVLLVITFKICETH